MRPAPWWGAVAALFAAGVGMVAVGLWVERRARFVYEGIHG